MMTLKSIELTSFKSFGRKSTVLFTTPITAVVGPNGSGKSNIVESIRFVLGEQSMKSLRGKGGVDLIFKGSKNLSQASRAQVLITFDNSQKIFSFSAGGDRSNNALSLDYDEVSIGREVFADGSNRYSINGTEVRLKDVVDLLSSVNIGSSGHHIISQGEADRVLNASNKDRRSMIEDALGLKVYQYRIKESERKLEKTSLNMKEVGALRREIAPHLNFLKKQVEKVEKAREMREELRDLYKDYFSKESTYIKNEIKRLTHSKRLLDERSVSLEERINLLNQNKNQNKEESVYIKEIKSYDGKLSQLRMDKDELSRKVGRIEGIIESLERDLSRVVEVKEQMIPESKWKSLVNSIESKVNQALSSEDLPELKMILSSIKESLSSFVDHKEDSRNQIDEELKYRYEEMKKVRSDLMYQIDEVSKSEKEIFNKISDLRNKEAETQNELRDNERVLYELMREKNEVDSDLHSISFEEEKLHVIKNAFEFELSEAGALIGREAISYANTDFEGEIIRQSQDDTRRKIERIKIKLEDAGLGNGSEVLKEYEETRDRDVFLAKELEDLSKSVENCKLLIQELKETLDREFKEGVGKINKQFQEFFSLMFGGGSAFLTVTMDHKKSRAKIIEEDEEVSVEDSQDENEIGFERGIEINVTLPQKKVKDLHMLSGGERSLTSIALLFAISQVNPPPFLVLDETDAALDEANSRKYGNMLENLSKYSQLIVVTHNRETMSRADVLYGVTLGADGASKLLSIRFEDAGAYAK
jgi:chromosome segregation protein